MVLHPSYDSAGSSQYAVERRNADEPMETQPDPTIRSWRLEKVMRPECKIAMRYRRIYAAENYKPGDPESKQEVKWGYSSGQGTREIPEEEISIRLNWTQKEEPWIEGVMTVPARKLK